MEEILKSIKLQIKILEEIQEKFKGCNKSSEVEVFMQISQQINELSKTALEILKNTATKL